MFTDRAIVSETDDLHVSALALPKESTFFLGSVRCGSLGEPCSGLPGIELFFFFVKEVILGD